MPTGSPAFLTSREAAAALGVKRATLYTYVSRGLIQTAAGPDGRQRLYRAADVARMRQQAASHRGHAAGAATAMRWGEPIVDSSITLIDADGPNYRGQPALSLIEAGYAFESVAELLWREALPDTAPNWPVCDPGIPAEQLDQLAHTATTPTSVLPAYLALLGARDPVGFAAPPAFEWARARTLLRRMSAAVALAGGSPDPLQRAEDALQAPTMGLSVAAALDCPAAQARHLELALILCADHELNASTFAVRVCASTGADLYACVNAGLATLSGPRHGGQSNRIEALLSEIARPERAPLVVADRLRRGEEVPGFGHPLYPNGDPRAEALIERALEIGGHTTPVQTLVALRDAMTALGHGQPEIDLGLVALRAALGLRPGTAIALFAIGRCAGWIAHALKQRTEGYLLRPRARYVGV